MNVPYSVDVDVRQTTLCFHPSPDETFDVIRYDRHPYSGAPGPHLDVRSVVVALEKRWVSWAHSDASPYSNIAEVIRMTAGQNNDRAKELLHFLLEQE